MYLKDEQRTVNEGIVSNLGSLSIALTTLPHPTPNMDVASLLNPTPPLPRRSCNKPYILEQIHFIQYCREDLKLSWPETMGAFIERFHDPARDVSIIGLQCRYYRSQVYPMLDIEGKPVSNDEDMIIMRPLTVRDRGQKRGLVIPILDGNQRPMYNEEGSVVVRELSGEELHGPLGSNLSATYQRYFKLVDRVPEHAADYTWVKAEHKIMARRNAKYNKDHGIGLPGAVVTGGVLVDTVLWDEQVARRNSISDEVSENFVEGLQVLSMRT